MLAALFLACVPFLVIGRSDTNTSTCPVKTTHGCSVSNQCDSCFELCGYCQNTENRTCSESHCMTCSDPSRYSLVPVSSDGTGYCEYIGNQQEISFREFENILHNHDLTYQTSTNDKLDIAPLLSITFLFDDRVFIFGGILFLNQGTTPKSVYHAQEEFIWGQVYVSDNEPVTHTHGSTPSPIVNTGFMCCACVFVSNHTAGCPADPRCEQFICAYDRVCCDNAWDWTCGWDALYTCNSSIPLSEDTTPVPTVEPTEFDTDYKVTCPSFIDGCSTDNVCDECYYLCEYCQNTDPLFTGTTCTEDNCMSCIDDYELIEDWIMNDGSGWCEAIETTPAPTAEYLLPAVVDWHIYELWGSLHNATYYFCTSQCYTTPVVDHGSSVEAHQADTVFMLFPFNCNDTKPILFEIYPKDILHGLMFERHEQYDLTEYLCDESIFEDLIPDSPLPMRWNEVCLAWHPEDFTLYIIYRDRILLFDVDWGLNYTAWSDVRLTGMSIDRNVSRGCTVDPFMKYVWITDDDAKLFAYDTSQDIVIDVGAYNTQQHPVEYYQDSNGYHRINATKYYYSYYDIKYPRMVPLNDDFILISSARSHHILKSNTTSRWYSSLTGTQTKYGDVLCHGTLPSDIHAFSAPVYRDYSVVHFGAFAMNESNCGIWDEQNLWHNCTRNVYPHHMISYFEWQKYWRLVLAPTSSSVLFGDRFVIDNQLVGGCDLSFYYERPYVYSIRELNPFGVEIYIESAIIYSTFMYLINGTIWVYGDGTRVHAARSCYLCPNALDFKPSTFDKEANVLAECVLCSVGIRTSVTDKAAAGIVYDIHMEMTQYYGSLVLDLQTEQTQILLKSCEPGYGIAAGSSVFDCNECPFNQFSLRPQLKPCIACSGVTDGIECEGGNRTILTYNWWVAAYDRNSAKLKPFYQIASYDAADYSNISDVPSDDTIITALCPPKYCCQSVIGCDYLSQYLSSNQSTQSASTLCAEGRDITVPLCGRCLPGYAEMLGTTKCGNTCDKEYLFLVPVTFLLTFALAIYVVFFDSKPRSYIADESDSNMKEINIMRLLKKDAIDGFQTILFKPVLYYFQSLSPILNTRGVTLWLSPVLAFFNFNLDAAGSDGSALCWSATLDANTEILLNLVFPVLLMFNILAPTLCINSSGRCRCYHRTVFQCFGIDFVPYYAASFFRILLIIIGVVLTVCFKYLTFIKVSDKDLMFYSADLEAFGAWWISGFVGILFIILCFVFLFWRIKIQDIEYRFASSNKYRKFVKSYKRKYWFWEFVLFSRRFFVALFTSIQFVGGDYTNFIFVLVLIIYFGLQIQYKPFAFTRVNRIETLCLILLLAAFVSSNFIRLNDDDTFVAAVLSFCILIPLILVGWYAIQILRFHLKMKRLEQASQTNADRVTTNRMLRKDMSRMLKRTPKSFKDALQDMEREIKEEQKEHEDEFDDIAITASTTKHIALCSGSEYAPPKKTDAPNLTAPTIDEGTEFVDNGETTANTNILETLMMDEIELVGMGDKTNNNRNNTTDNGEEEEDGALSKDVSVVTVGSDVINEALQAMETEVFTSNESEIVFRIDDENDAQNNDNEDNEPHTTAN